jgi:hypothetical protein
MRLSVVLAVVALACASEVVGTSENKEHYAALHKIIAPLEDAMTSVALSELRVHVGLKNPMKIIDETCAKMRTEIYAERKLAMQKEDSDVKLCKSTLARYKAYINQQNSVDQSERSKALTDYNTHVVLVKPAAALNETRKARNATIGTQEVHVARGQSNRDGEHVEFLNLKAAFEYALGNVSLIRRVLNGEGTLNELHGAVGFLEEGTCSSHMNQLAEASAHVPQLFSMLQVFSKAFSRVEAIPVAKTGLKTQAKVQKSSGDMDAINTILAKVRENLVKALKLAIDQENNMITLWKSSKRKQRNGINTNWRSNADDFKNQGEIEEKAGRHWESEGAHKISAAQAIKKRDETQILKDFLGTRCGQSRISHQAFMTNKANELNALDAVMRYLKEHVFPKWSKKIVDVVSSPYTWKVESPNYVKVSNTYSTTAHPGDDATTCRTSFSTVFSKVRLLTATNGQKYLDPNDLTHSTNMNTKRTSKVEGIDCQLFPTGVPLGRAHSCSVEGDSSAKVDLTGTGFKFGKAALRMFKILGRETKGSKVSLSSSGLVLTLKVHGRCGDLYGDDAAMENVDYRSDPIPLEDYGIVKEINTKGTDTMPQR